MLDRPVVLYSLRECPHCEAARGFLRARGIAFVERDVREEAGAIRDLTRLTGESVVPTLVYGDDVQVGWDAGRAAEMFDDPLPPEEEDRLLAFIEEAVRAQPAPPLSPLGTETDSPVTDPLVPVQTSAGTPVVSAEVRAAVPRSGQDCTSPAE